jgi:hypothetical protein
LKQVALLGYQVLTGNSEEMRLLGRSRYRWKDNIKIDLREVGLENADWNNLAQDREQWWAFVNMLMNLWVS